MAYEIQFELLPKQAAFVASEKRVAIFSGGRGAGKTIAGVAKIVTYATQYPGSRILVVAQTYDLLKNVIYREFLENVPSEFILHKAEKPYIDLLLDTDPPTSVAFRAFNDSSKAKFGNQNLIIVDEASDIDSDILQQLATSAREPTFPQQIRFLPNPGLFEHSLYKVYIEPTLAGKRTDCDFFSMSTFENGYLSPEYIAQQRLLKETDNAYYQRFILGNWGDFESDMLGAFKTVPKFTAQYLICWVDGSYSNKQDSDRTAVCVLGIKPVDGVDPIFWPIEFTGVSFEKSVSDPATMRQMLLFIDKFKPLECVLESQLSDSTSIFFDAFAQVECELGLTPNLWTHHHQRENKHEKIMARVAANKQRIFMLEDTPREFYAPIIQYRKNAKPDDQADSLASAIRQWLESKVLSIYLSFKPYLS